MKNWCALLFRRSARLAEFRVHSAVLHLTPDFGPFHEASPSATTPQSRDEIAKPFSGPNKFGKKHQVFGLPISLAREIISPNVQRRGDAWSRGCLV